MLAPTSVLQHEDPDRVDISGDWTLLRFLEHSGTDMLDALLERDTSRKYSLWWIQQAKCQPTV